MKLELDSSSSISSSSLNGPSLGSRTEMRLSRSGKPLPPSNLSPSVVCDFQGVDGGRTPFLELSKKSRDDLGLLEIRKEVPSTTSKGKGKAKAKDEDAVGDWHETLPIQSTAKGMGTSWNELKEAPTYPELESLAGNDEIRERMGTEEIIESLEETQSVAKGKLPRLPLDDGELV